MPEEILLSAPVQASAGATRFRIAWLGFQWDLALITIRFREWTGSAFGPREITATYEGAQAITLMTQLNKVDLSVKSLHTRVMEKLALDGKLPTGTISGAPE